MEVEHRSGYSYVLTKGLAPPQKPHFSSLDKQSQKMAKINILNGNYRGDKSKPNAGHLRKSIGIDGSKKHS